MRASVACFQEQQAAVQGCMEEQAVLVVQLAELQQALQSAGARLPTSGGRIEL